MKFTNSVVLPGADFAIVCATIVSSWGVIVENPTQTFIATLFNAIVDHGASTFVTSEFVKIKVMIFAKDDADANGTINEYIDFTGVELPIKRWFVGMCYSFGFAPNKVGFRKLIRIGSLMKQHERFRSTLEYSYMNGKTKYAEHEAADAFATNIEKYDAFIKSIVNKNSTLHVDSEKLERTAKIKELFARARAVGINGV